MTENKLIKVSPKEYKETTNPCEYLVTTGLDSCVGIALVSDVNNTRKRGLAHVLYTGSVEFDNEGFARLKNSDKESINNQLETMIKPWNGLKNLEVYIVANRFREEKAKLRESDEPGLINPAYDLVYDWFSKIGINPKLGDSVHDFRKESNPDDKKLYAVHWKDMILHRDKLNIMYKDGADKWLNTESYSHYF